MKEFASKVALVSGGSRDIGRAVSVELARRGAKVAVNYFNSEAGGDATLAEIEAFGGEAIKLRADVTVAADVERMVAQTREAFGDAIHILVNVTGGLVQRRTLDAMDEEFFNFVMQLNMTSTFLLTKAVAPHMPEGSAIVNFASQAGRDGGGPGAAAYSAAKGAVMTFTRSMAKELGPRGIRVNSLCPGMIATTFHDTFTKDEVRRTVESTTPLRRQGNAAEVARTVACLAGDETAFVTGANIDVNGGMLFS